MGGLRPDFLNALPDRTVIRMICISESHTGRSFLIDDCLGNF